MNKWQSQDLILCPTVYSHSHSDKLQTPQPGSKGPPLIDFILPCISQLLLHNRPSQNTAASTSKRLLCLMIPWIGWAVLPVSKGSPGVGWSQVASFTCLGLSWDSGEDLMAGASPHMIFHPPRYQLRLIYIVVAAGFPGYWKGLGLFNLLFVLIDVPFCKSKVTRPSPGSRCGDTATS